MDDAASRAVIDGNRGLSLTRSYICDTALSSSCRMQKAIAFMVPDLAPLNAAARANSVSRIRYTLVEKPEVSWRQKSMDSPNY